MTEELLDATMTCPHKAAMMAAGWDQRGVEVGKLTRRHIDAAAARVLGHEEQFEDILRGATVLFEAESTRRPYLGLPLEADPWKVYEGHLAILTAALYAVRAAFGTYTAPPGAIAVIRSHGTWTEQQRQDLRFNLHLQGMMVQARAQQPTHTVAEVLGQRFDVINPNLNSRVLYQPLVLGHRGPDGQDSPLTRCWYHTQTGQAAWAHDWTDAGGSHRLGSDWKKMYVQADQSRDWIERVRKVQPQAGDPFQVIFPPAVEVHYNPALAAVWQNADARARLNYEGMAKHWNQCNRPGERCPFIEHCWDSDDHHLVKLAGRLLEKDTDYSDKRMSILKKEVEGIKW